MTEYELEIGDSPDPMSRLAFLNMIEGFLNGLKDSGIIKSYKLSTPYGRTTLFRVKEVLKK